MAVHLAAAAALSTGGSSAGGGFNVAKLGRTAKIMADSDKQQADAYGAGDPKAMLLRLAPISHAPDNPPRPVSSLL